MSAQLFSNLLLINKSTFITEDITFLTSFFSLQNDLPQEKYIKPWVWLLIVCITVSSLLDWIYFTSGISLVTAVICLPYVWLNLQFLIYLRYNEYRLKNLFNNLCAYFRDIHNLLKKLLNLAQELQVIEKNCSLSDSRHLKVVKSTFTIAIRLFIIFRDETKLALSLPATVEDVNCEDNYISCLPSQLFEEFLKEEDPTPFQLKSLIQLVRIQQSEFLRRILCAHISGTLEEKCKVLRIIINSLQQCNNKITCEYTKLVSLHAFHHASFYKEDQVPASSSSFKSPTVDHDYSIRQIRLHLRAALMILENFEKLPTNDKSNKLEDLEKIEKEIVSGIEYVKVMSKRFFKHGNKENFKLIDSPKGDEKVDRVPTVIIGENYQPTIEDQVFELYIDDDDCLDLQYQDDIEDSPMTSDDFAAISSNLFQELKTALIPKAKEIREREAKALGIFQEKVPVQLDIDSKSIEPPKIPLSMRQDNQHDRNFFSHNSSFTTNLAARAAQISKDLNLNSLEECFGDSDDDGDLDNCDAHPSAS